MRKLSTILLIIVLIIVPAVSIGALGVVIEGDVGWDCETMGNEECGPDADVGLVIEGAPGWDCLSMGNGVCGEDGATGDSLVAPAYGSTSQFDLCGEELFYCVTESDAVVGTGAIEVLAEAAGPGVEDCTGENCEDAIGAWVTRSLRVSHIVERGSPAILYTMTMDLDSSELVAPISVGQVQAYVDFDADHVMAGDPIGCSADLKRGFFPRPHEDPTGLTSGIFLPVDPEPGRMILETRLTCYDRSTSPFTPVDVPSGLEVKVTVAGTARAFPERSMIGTGVPTPAGVARASFEASRTEVHATFCATRSCV